MPKRLYTVEAMQTGPRDSDYSYIVVRQTETAIQCIGSYAAFETACRIAKALNHASQN